MVVIKSEDGRRCDERCYNARRLGCSCVCGGKNHGLGMKHALDVANELRQEADEGRENNDRVNE